MPRKDHEINKLVQIEPYRVLQSDEEGQRLETYSPFDPIDLPRQLIDLLPFFDGRSTEEVLEEIASEHEIEVAPELVRRLTDFRVLTGA